MKANVVWNFSDSFPGSSKVDTLNHSGCWGHGLHSEDVGGFLGGLNQVADLDRSACIRRVLRTVGCRGWWIHVDTQYVHDIYNILYNIKTDYHMVDAFKDL